MILAKNTGGHITGVDMVADFINIFNDASKKHNFSDRVYKVLVDALKTPF